MRKREFLRRRKKSIFPRLAFTLISLVLLFSGALSTVSARIAIHNLSGEVDRQETQLLRQYASYFDQAITSNVIKIGLGIIVNDSFQQYMENMKTSRYANVDMYNYLKRTRISSSFLDDIAFYDVNADTCVSTNYGLKYLDTQTYALDRYQWIDAFRMQNARSAWLVIGGQLMYISAYPTAHTPENATAFVMLSVSMKTVLSELSMLNVEGRLSLVDINGVVYDAQGNYQQTTADVVTEETLVSGLKIRKVTSLASLYNAAYRTQRQILLSGVILMLLGVVSAVAISYFVYKPLHGISKNAETGLAYCGEELTSMDEFRLINHSIASMRNHIQRLNAMIGASMSALRSDLAISLLSGVLVDESAVIDKLASVGIPLSARSFNVMLVSLSARADAEHIDLITETGSMTFDNGYALAAMKTPLEMAIVLMCVGSDEKALVESVIEDIRKCIRHKAIALGSWTMSILELNQSNRMAERALRYAFVDSATELFCAEETERRQGLNEALWTPAISAWARALRVGGAEEAYLSLNAIISALQKNAYDYETHMFVLDKCAEALKSACVYMDEGAHTRVKQTLAQFGEAENLRDAFACLQEVADELAETRRSASALRTETIIESIKNYIFQHLSESPRLSEMSEALGLSESHMSRIFKTATGMSITDYCMKMRIDEVAHTLRDTNLMISEIAANLGYASPQYLARQFKEAFGMSPKEYRLKVRDAAHPVPSAPAEERL